MSTRSKHQVISQPRSVNLLARPTPKARDLQRYFLEHTDPTMRELPLRVDAVVAFIDLLSSVLSATRAISHGKKAMSAVQDRGVNYLRVFFDAMTKLYPDKDIAPIISAILDNAVSSDEIEKVIRDLKGPHLHFNPPQEGFSYALSVTLREGVMAATTYRVTSSIASNQDLPVIPHFRIPGARDSVLHSPSGITLDPNGSLLQLIYYARYGFIHPLFADLPPRLGFDRDDMQRVVTAPPEAFDSEGFSRIISAGDIGSAAAFLVFWRFQALALSRRTGEGEDDWLFRNLGIFVNNLALHEATHAMDVANNTNSNMRSLRNRLFPGKTRAAPEITAELIQFVYGSPLHSLMGVLFIHVACLSNKGMYLADYHLKVARNDIERIYTQLVQRFGLLGFVKLTEGQLREAARELLDQECHRLYGNRHDEVYDIAELRRIAAMDFVLPADMQILRLISDAVFELIDKPRK